MAYKTQDKKVIVSSLRGSLLIMPSTVEFTIDGYDWFNILKGIGDSIGDANLQFLPRRDDVAPQQDLPIFERDGNLPGVSLQSLTKSQAMMTCLSLPSDFFKTYHASKPVIVAVNFGDKERGIVPILKQHLTKGSKLKVEVFSEATCPYILHTIRQGKKGVKRIKYFTLILDGDTLSANYGYCASSEVNIRELHKQIQSMKIYKSHVDVSFHDYGLGAKRVDLKCKGMIGEVEISLDIEGEGEDDAEDDDVKKENTNKRRVKEEVEDEFDDIFSSNDINTKDGEEEEEEEEEQEYEIGTSNSRKRKRKGKGKKDSEVPICLSLETDQIEEYGVSLAFKFLCSATSPMSERAILYWGDPDTSSTMPFAIEHDLGRGGRLIYYICPLMEPEYESMMKDS